MNTNAQNDCLNKIWVKEKLMTKINAQESRTCDEYEN